MFGWFFKNRYKKLEEKTEKSFISVRNDMDIVGKWIKHLGERDKQLFDIIFALQKDLSSIKSELSSLREGISLTQFSAENKQLLKKTAVLHKQTAVEHVENSVQTTVQTANFYDIFKNLSSNERSLLFTLMNSDLKLSYEDLALLLGKERSTIRGQVNAIKQKREGLIKEVSEKNGKKRVYVPNEIKEKLAKYAKVRVTKVKKGSVNSDSEEKEKKEDKEYD